MFYIKRALVVEAFKLGVEPIPDWAKDKIKPYGLLGTYKSGAIIKTLEGDMHAKIGDYIIKGVEGEIYPCKPGIFRKTYDAA